MIYPDFSNDKFDVKYSKRLLLLSDVVNSHPTLADATSDDMPPIVVDNPTEEFADTNFANTDLVFNADRVHDANAFALNVINASHIGLSTGNAYVTINNLDQLVYAQAQDGVDTYTYTELYHNGFFVYGTDGDKFWTLGLNPGASVLQYYNGTNIYGFRADNLGIELYTSGISASLGDVLTLSASGRAEWATPSGGGGPDTNFATSNLTFTGNRTHNLGGYNLTLGNFDYLDFTTSSTYTAPYGQLYIDAFSINPFIEDLSGNFSSTLLESDKVRNTSTNAAGNFSRLEVTPDELVLTHHYITTPKTYIIQFDDGGIRINDGVGFGTSGQVWTSDGAYGSWQTPSGGGSVGTLQQVTDLGNTTTNIIMSSVSIRIQDTFTYVSLSKVVSGANTGGGVSLKAQTSSNVGVLYVPTAAAQRSYAFPDKDGTVAMLSDISGGTPTLQAVLTASSVLTSNALITSNNNYRVQLGSTSGVYTWADMFGSSGFNMGTQLNALQYSAINMSTNQLDINSVNYSAGTSSQIQLSANGNILMHGHVKFNSEFTPTGSADSTYDTTTIKFDSNYLYYKTTGAGWKRVALSTF